MFAAVSREVAVVAVDHGQACARVAGEVEGGDPARSTTVATRRRRRMQRLNMTNLVVTRSDRRLVGLITIRDAEEALRELQG